MFVSQLYYAYDWGRALSDWQLGGDQVAGCYSRLAGLSIKIFILILFCICVFSMLCICVLLQLCSESLAIVCCKIILVLHLFCMGIKIFILIAATFRCPPPPCCCCRCLLSPCRAISNIHPTSNLYLSFNTILPSKEITKSNWMRKFNQPWFCGLAALLWCN